MECAMSETIEITVEGMGCQKCVAAVEGAVKRISPTADVEVKLAEGRVRVSGAGVSRDRIETAIEDAGYDVLRA
jgi:copper chaperone